MARKNNTRKARVCKVRNASAREGFRINQVRGAIQWVLAMHALYGVDAWHPDDPIEGISELESWRWEAIEAFGSEEILYRVIEAVGIAQKQLLDEVFREHCA